MLSYLLQEKDTYVGADPTAVSYWIGESVCKTREGKISPMMDPSAPPPTGTIDRQ